MSDTQESIAASRDRATVSAKLASVLFFLAAIAYLSGGMLLALAGGSTGYFITGICLLVTALMLWRGRVLAIWLFVGVCAATFLWAMAEADGNPWALIPRLDVLGLLGLILALTPSARAMVAGAGSSRSWLLGAISLTLVVPAAGTAFLIANYDREEQSIGGAAELPAIPGAGAGKDWTEYGGGSQGMRYSTLAQIDRTNVDKLKVAWTYRFGEAEPYGLQVTPLKVGELVYACSSRNKIVALDADTGKETWSYDPRVDLTGVPFRGCRGVAYYAVPAATGLCAQRIYTGTADARVIALDAATGRPCSGFGVNGEVSMLDGLGKVIKGYYYFTSPPLVARGKIVLGATVTDNQYVGEPSGVIRALDAVTGKLSWAYDIGAPDRIGSPPPGQGYTRGTPNSWAPMSFDEETGLVYVPMGNATPDYFAAVRRPIDEQISSAVLALNADTGRRAWVFKTLHKDVWDYDVASQPVVVNGNAAQGRPAELIQVTKRGEIFMVDPQSGTALAKVVEKRVPQTGAVPEERLSPTQPFSIGMPSLAGPPLTESSMWGVSPFDEMWCRIAFRNARYDGPLTPPGLQTAIQYPGYLGGMDWGGASVDPGRGILVTVTNHVANLVRLVPKSEVDRAHAYPMGMGRVGAEALGGILSQRGTPYGAMTQAFLSPLSVPCQRPPWSRLSAIDLHTRKVIWSHPLGMAKESGPFGIKSKLPLRVGVPALGGAIVTAGGVTFVGASIDRTFRAFDTATGRILWKSALPESGNATPMAYRSDRTGRQYVVIAAGGHKILGTKATDQIVAFALPK